MKIPYSNKTLIWDLVIGLGFLSNGIILIIKYQYNDWIDIFYALFIPFIALSMFLYRYFFKYLTIENGIIKTNSLFSSKIRINDIREIKKKKRFYTLKSEDKKLTIITHFIDQKSLNTLESEFDKLDL